MSTEKPAGFFSTFSILDPDGTQEGQTRAQRRNRRVFVCIPCHRRKLKCDKGQPCSRCVQCGAADECVYQPLPLPPQPDPTPTPEPEVPPASSVTQEPSVQDRTRSCYRIGDGRARVSGTTHWAKIICEFEEACPYIFGTDPQWEPRYRQIKGLKYLFAPLSSGNFPFSNIGSIATDKQHILESLPPRNVVQALLKCYFQSFELTHRLLHQHQFWDEMHSFWNSGDQVLDGWLAQLCIMLALGCQTAPDFIFHGTARSASEWTETLLDMAQLSFGRSAYMLMPNLTTIRTLCMMVTAKMLELVKGSSADQAVFLMGFVTRLAMTMQLHRTTTLFPAMPAFEAEMRRRVWVTVQLLDLDVAIRSGTSFICREQDAEPPLNINETDFRRSEHGAWIVDSLWAGPQEYTDGMFQVKLADLIPLLAEVVGTANSPTKPVVAYERVLAWDSQIRRKLRDAGVVFSLPPGAGSRNRPDRVRRATLQLQFLQVLGHRARLALHHAYARVPHVDRFEKSYGAIMDSSLALLRMQEMWTGMAAAAADGSSDGSRASSPSSGSTDDAAAGYGYGGWLVDLCHDDFNTAMLYIILALRRNEFGGGIGTGGGSSRSQAQDDPTGRERALEALRRGMNTTRERACRSLAHFKEFLGLSVLVSCLQCLGRPETVLPTLMRAADTVEQTVLAGKQDVASWMETGSGLFPEAGLHLDAIMEMDPGMFNSFT